MEKGPKGRERSESGEERIERAFGANLSEAIAEMRQRGLTEESFAELLQAKLIESGVEMNDDKRVHLRRILRAQQRDFGIVEE
jgi:hypothetical protein